MKIAKHYILLALLVLVLPSNISAASFDCNNSITKAETAICSDPALSKLDEDLGVVYSLHSKLVDDKALL